MLNFRRKRSAESEASAQRQAVAVDAPRQPFRKAIVPVIACGAGLFSDGYINNVSAPTYLCGPIRILAAVLLGLHPPRFGSPGDQSLVFANRRGFLTAVGHRLRHHRAWPAVRRPVQELHCKGICQRHRLCRHSRRPAGLRMARRPLVADQLAAGLDRHLDGVYRARCGVILSW